MPVQTETSQRVYAEERQNVIVEVARSDGRVDNMELARRFGVTPETVRRDLGALERHGVLHRVRGGAIPVERLGFQAAVAARSLVHQDEKERIARLALQEVPPEGAILLDAATTTAQLAQRLPVGRELTVVTNSLLTGLALAGRSGLTVLTLGGRVRGRTFAGVDAWALHVLGQIVVDVAFIGANGISLERGLTTLDPAEAAVKRMMSRARDGRSSWRTTRSSSATSSSGSVSLTTSRWSSATPGWTALSPTGSTSPTARGARVIRTVTAQAQPQADAQVDGSRTRRSLEQRTETVGGCPGTGTAEDRRP